MQTGTNQEEYPCPDCQGVVQLGRSCGQCNTDFYSEDVELATEVAEFEMRAMFPEMSDAELADVARVAEDACPPSTDAMDRGWM
ncbi:MAG: hypothetical protein V3V08_23170 [Nannocystaceae bacterium]